MYRKSFVVLLALFIGVVAYLGNRYLNLKERELQGYVGYSDQAEVVDECRDSVSGEMYDYFVITDRANLRVDAGVQNKVVSVLSNQDKVSKIDEKFVVPDLQNIVTNKEVLFTTATSSFTLPANMVVGMVDAESEDSPMAQVSYAHPELGALEARVPKDVLDLTQEPKLWFKIRNSDGAEGWVSKKLLSVLDAC